MTRKDYVTIAQAINATRYTLDPSILGEPVYANGINTAMSEVAGRLADSMAQDNPRFDRERFLNACGVTTK
jgi:hypothetical protein